MDRARPCGALRLDNRKQKSRARARDRMIYVKTGSGTARCRQILEWVMRHRHAMLRARATRALCTGVETIGGAVHSANLKIVVWQGSTRHAPLLF